MAASFDDKTKSTVQKIPLLTVKAGPRDGETWKNRVKEVSVPLLSTPLPE
jgi:ufm1-conjugating enzyme 1